MFDFLSEEYRPPPIEGKGEHGPVVRHRIQPELCETYTQEGPLTVTYPSGARIEPIGVEVHLRQVMGRPRVHFCPRDTSALYTLLMVDPDLPLSLGASCHWMVVNIPGKDWDVSRGTQISSYADASPPWGSGSHRYVFLVLRQKTPLVPRAVKLTFARRGFNIRTFARANDLSDPVGINFFRAGYGATCKATAGTGVFLIAAPIVYTVRAIPVIIRFIPTAIRWIPAILRECRDLCSLGIDDRTDYYHES